MPEGILVLHDDVPGPAHPKALLDLNVSIAVTSDWVEALEAIMLSPPSILVLYLRSQQSARQVCRQVRRRSSHVSLVVLLDEGNQLDTISMLELGADDCIITTMDNRELLARFRALLRRTAALKHTKPQRVFRFDEIQVNFDTMELSREGRLVPLTRQEFKVLEFFISNQHRVLSRDELLNQVWGYTSYPTTRTVDTHVFRLRRKLEKHPMEPAYFRTVHGSGYKFVAQ